MAQLIDESKTQKCPNCEGSGFDPADESALVLAAGESPEEVKADPQTPNRPSGAEDVIARRGVDPREGCPVCAGTGEVPADNAVILETDDLEKLVKESHKHADVPTIIVGVETSDLPLIEAKPPKDQPPSLEDRVAALEKSQAKG